MDVYIVKVSRTREVSQEFPSVITALISFIKNLKFRRIYGTQKIQNQNVGKIYSQEQ